MQKYRDESHICKFLIVTYTLSSLGGYRALQVRLDCYFRCRDALVKAREDAAAPRDGLDNLSILRRERRVRLLEAAVARCRGDLHSSSVQAALSLPPSGASAPGDPYAFSVLSPEACRALESLLAASGDFGGLDAAAQAMIHYAGVTEPDPALVAPYADIYARFREDIRTIYGVEG